MGIIQRIYITTCLLLAAFALSAQSEGFIFHEVKPGETKYGIAREYQVSIEQLEKFNPEIKDGLRAGTNLLIPLPKPEPKLPENASAPKDSGRFLYHQVKPDETLYSLSRDYGVSIRRLETLNPFLKEGLKVGQTLRIPRDSAPTATAAPPVDTTRYGIHYVQKGETAYSLMQRYDWTLDSLYLVNPAAEEGLQIGQRLLIPRHLYRQALATSTMNPVDSLPDQQKPKAKPGTDPVASQGPRKAPGPQEDYFLYKVKTGDTFYALERKFNVEKSELLALNPELEEGLFLDRYIIVPRKEKAPELSWLEKLFAKAQEPEPLEPLTPNTRKLKDSLNLPPNAMESVPEIDSDTLQVDTQKTYRVALLLPFMAHLPLDTITTDQPRFGGLSSMALDFYQGLRLAADTLAQQGMNLQLQVYDTRNQAQRVTTLADRLQRQQVDLVVGPAYNRHLEVVARKLEADGIPVVSPLSATVDVTGHPNLVQAIPGKDQKNKRLAAILNRRFPGARVIFAHSGSVADLQQVQIIKSRLEARAAGNYLDKLVVSQEELAKTDRLKEALAGPGGEVVVLVGEDQVFINDLVRKLHTFHDSAVSILSSQSLLESKTLEYSYLDDLNLTMAEVRYPRYADTATQAFMRRYRRQFSREPSLFAFQGYDMGLYFLRKLWQNGPYFLSSLPGPAQEKTSLGFAFRHLPQGGYQNQFLHVTGLRNMQWVILPAPGQKTVSQKNKAEFKD